MTWVFGPLLQNIAILWWLHKTHLTRYSGDVSFLGFRFKNIKSSRFEKWVKTITNNGIKKTCLVMCLINKYRKWRCFFFFLFYCCSTTVGHQDEWAVTRHVCTLLHPVCCSTGVRLLYNTVAQYYTIYKPRDVHIRLILYNKTTVHCYDSSCTWSFIIWALRGLLSMDMTFKRVHTHTHTQTRARTHTVSGSSD